MVVLSIGRPQGNLHLATGRANKLVQGDHERFYLPLLLHTVSTRVPMVADPFLFRLDVEDARPARNSISPCVRRRFVENLVFTVVTFVAKKRTTFLHKVVKLECVQNYTSREGGRNTVPYPTS
jgi:hypothetical protein